MQAKLTAIATAMALAGAWVSVGAHAGQMSGKPESSSAMIEYDLKQARAHLYVAEASADEVAREIGGARGASDEAVIAAYVAENATQRARVLLPEGSESRDLQHAFERLQQAAQEHRETIQSLSVLPPSAGRDEAIEEARTALIETQAAMMAIGSHLS